MNYCKNKTLQIFLERLVDELKQENLSNESWNSLYDDDRQPYDIPFIIAPLSQAFSYKPERYFNFISDLENCNEYDICIQDRTYHYIAIDVQLYGRDLKKYFYVINIDIDARYDGYCQCQPGDKDYREDKCCCGHTCDWGAPYVEIIKCDLIGNHIFIGDESSYWSFEDEFYKEDREAIVEKKRIERENKIERLKNTIEESVRELMKLQNESS